MNRKLLDHLLKSGVCASSALQRAAAVQRSRGGDLMEILIEQSGVDENALARSLGTFYNWKVVDLSRIQIQGDALNRANGEFCRRHLLLPFSIDRNGGALLVAVADPARAHRALRSFQSKTGQKVRPFVAARSRIVQGIEQHYGGSVALEDPLESGVGLSSMGIGGGGGGVTYDSQMSRPPGGSGRVESFSSIDQFFDDSSQLQNMLGDSGLGANDVRDASFFGGAFSSEIVYADRSRGPVSGTSSRGHRSELSGFDPMGSPNHSGAAQMHSTAGHTSAAEIERLQSENLALRQKLHRVETSLQLEINLLRELVELLLEAGVIDRRAYLERMSKLR